MRRLVLLAAARRDLVTIDRYVIQQSGSVAIATRFTGQLRERCLRLASLPGTLGIARPDLGQAVRCVAQGNYLIMFRYTPSSMEVLRVIEGHRDVDRNFQPGNA